MIFAYALIIAIWVFELVYAVVCDVKNTKIDPVPFICAVLICIIHFFEKMMEVAGAN